MPSFWLRFLGFFYPVTLRKGSTEFNPDLELCYFRGRHQLGTADTLYSDGTQYRPLIEGFRKIESDLPGIKRVLVLGTGLASAVHLLDKRQLYPFFRLIEIDPQVLQWAVEFLPEKSRENVDPVCMNALTFIEQDKDFYDLIIVDIFFGRTVPADATEPEFIRHCRKRLNPSGRLIMNYMVGDQKDAKPLKTTLEAVFSQVEEIGFGPNRVFVTKS